MGLPSTAFRQVCSRAHQRVDVLPSILKHQEFIAVDLSEGGMQLRCDHTVRVGEKVELKLTLDRVCLNIKGEIRWCRQSDSVFNTDYAVGVEFTNHSIAEQLEIRHYIDKKLTKKEAPRKKAPLRQHSLRRHNRAKVPGNILNSTLYQAVDLSESGVQLRAREATRVGKVLDIPLTIKGEKLTLKGIVRWCRESPSAYDEDYLCGVEFTDMRIAAQLSLRHYVEQLNLSAS